MKQVVTRWAGLWRSTYKPYGEHFLFEECQPKLFLTRRGCREWINKMYGYIKERPDLRVAPHGWRLPMAVKVTVTLVSGGTGGSK